MSAADRTMTRIGHGVALGSQGDRAGARELFTGLWNDIGGAVGDPLYRCALAHSMADVQDDLADELLWDQRALDAADMVTDARVQEAGMPGTAAALSPSLHLNLGDGHRRLGNLDHAREHLSRGTAAADALATTVKPRDVV